MKNEKWKRIGAVALSAAMVLPLIPGVAYAEETPAPDSAQYVASEAVEETLAPDSTELIATESVEETTAPESEVSAVMEAVEETLIPDSTEYVAGEAIEELSAGQEAKQQTYKIKIEAPIGYRLSKVSPDGTVDESPDYAAPGDRINVGFRDSFIEGKVDFVRFVDGIGNITDLENGDTYDDCWFTMPDGDVLIRAEMTENCNLLTVENGGIMVPMGDAYLVLNNNYCHPGKEVFLHYDQDKTPEGKTFSEWYVKSGNVQLSNPTSTEDCKLTMPDHPVEIGVKYKDAFAISVENGYAQYYKPNGEFVYLTNRAEAGTHMQLKVNPYTRPEGMAFSKWVVTKGNVELDQPYLSYKCPFVMPAEDVAIKAEFVPGHSFKVEGGSTCKTTSDGFDWYIPYAAPGDSVWAVVDSNQIPEDMEFSRWVVRKGNVELENPQASSCKFIMPDEDVEIYAEYRDNTKYSVSVENGQAQYTDSDGAIVENATEALSGTQIQLKIDPSAWPEGMAFSKWVAKSGNVQLKNAYTSRYCTFVMPSEPVEIAAEFVPGHSVTLQDGSMFIETADGPDGSVDGFYMAAPGDIVWINLESGTAPEEKDFSKWIVSKGNVQIDNPTGTSTWFIMPDEDVEIYPEYKDIPTAQWVWSGDHWMYQEADGKYVTSAFKDIDGQTYYFDANGYMQKGWQWIDSAWYYFNGSGYMQTGWQWIDSHWFYLNSEGQMQKGWQWIDSHWFYLNSSGHMQKGWQWIDSAWYYFNGSGHMQTGWQWIDGSCYYFYGNGAMAKNTWIDGSYVNNSGIWEKNPVLTGWQSNSTGWWYNDANGNYVTGWQWIDGAWYYFSGNGYMQTGWQWIDGYWFYLDGSGHMQKGWQWIDGYWFYLDGSGHMLKGWQQIDGYWFYLDGSGHMLKGWQWIGSNWFYLDGSGHMQKGWQWIDSHWYYFYDNGAMAVDTTIDGCYVNGSGIWVS